MSVWFRFGCKPNIFIRFLNELLLQFLCENLKENRENSPKEGVVNTLKPQVNGVATTGHCGKLPYLIFGILINI